MYHVDGSEVEYQDHDKVSKEDSITFDAEHFSTYAVVIYTSNNLNRTYSFKAETVELKNGKFSDITASNTTRVQFEVNNQGEQVYPTSLKKEISNYSFVGAFVDVNTEIDYFSVQKDGNKYYPYYRTKNGNYEWCDDETIYFVYSSGTALATTGTVVVAVRNDGKIPSEPSIQGDYYTYIGEGKGGGKPNVTLSTIFNPITTDKTGYTNGKRVDAVVGAEAVEGRLQPGFYDLFPERFSYSINGQWKTFNPDTQYVDWYVIKYQYSDEKWHIDGVVRDKAKFTLDYEENIPQSAKTNGGLIPDGDEYAQGTTVEVKGLPRTNPLSVEGYTFDGWNTQKNGSGTAYKAGDTIKLNNNVTLYAQWKKSEYTITYYLDGGTAQGNNPTKYTASTNTFTLTNPIKPGYTFKGWSGTGLTGDTNKNVTVVKGSTGKREYTAHWTQDEYPITYYLDGGTAQGNNPTKYTVSTNTFTLTNPIRPGYTFKGWSGTDLDGDENTSVTVAKGSIGDREYTANWTINKYKIRYDLSGGKLKVGEENPVEYYVTSANITLINPTRPGYTFTGWSGTDLEGSANTTVTIPTGSIGDRVYTAHWIIDESKKYTVTYEAQKNS